MNKTSKQWAAFSPEAVIRDASTSHQFHLLKDAKEDIAQLSALVERVARLNPNAGEIGAGMLANLILDAQEILTVR